MNFKEGSEKPKSWKEIWGSGQGIGAIEQVQPTGAVVDRLESEFIAAQTRLSGMLQRS
jgi:nitronate monooxygenase